MRLVDLVGDRTDDLFLAISLYEFLLSGKQSHGLGDNPRLLKILGAVTVALSSKQCDGVVEISRQRGPIGA